MKKPTKKTIFIRLFIPLFVVMILQATIFYISTIHGTIIHSLNANSENLLSERVVNRESELETKFTSQWGNLTFYANVLNDLYGRYRSESKRFYTNTEMKKHFLQNSYDTLYSVLRNNAVNGVFLILTNSPDGEQLSEQEQEYYGLCLRDYDLTSGYSGNEDLLILRCPSAITSKLGCSLDNAWNGLYSFSKSTDPGDFFYKPLEHAYANPGVDADNFAYFCGSHTYSTADRDVVSYSIPLINGEGEIYGVLGVELLNTYLSSILPYSELQGKNNSAYMLVQYTKGQENAEVLTSNGALYNLCFDGEKLDLNTLHTTDDNRVFSYTGKNNIRICGASSPLTIYNKNTPFENEIVSLVGIVREDSLFSVSMGIRNSLLTVILLILLIGVAAIFLVSRWLSRPVIRAARNLEEHVTTEERELEHTGIFEVDQLIDAITRQSRTINQTRAQSEFFMMISHEIRTPLNAINGYLDMDLEEHEKHGWNDTYVKRSKTAVAQLSGIADEMLDYTRITDGSAQLKERMFDIKDMVRRLDHNLSLAAQKKDLSFRVRAVDITHRYLLGDELRIELVMQHLMENAVKFTEAGGKVKAKVREITDPGGKIFLEFECTDTGKGMSEEFCRQVCAPFSQSDKSYSRTHGGLGIGLYLSRYFINAMNGSFHVDSQEGKGSRFLVTMEVRLPDEEALEQQDARLKEKKSQTQGERVLEKFPGIRAMIVEDNRINADILMRLLQKLDIQSTVFENGKLAVDAFLQAETGQYQIIFMDIQMPVMNGYEAAEAIRGSATPEGKTIPIVAVSANAFETDVANSLASGMNQHLAKPVDIALIAEAVKKFCTRQ